MAMDLTELDWQDAPLGFDPDGYHTQIAETSLPDGSEAQLIIGCDIDFRRTDMVFQLEGKWHSTSSTQDWPVFDRLFGRAEWQAFVKEHEQEAVRELERDEEDMM